MKLLRITALSAMSALALLAGCNMTSGGKSAAVSMKNGAPAPAAAPTAKPAAAKPSTAPQSVAAPAALGTKACPATPLQGAWMSEEVRQGANKQLVPVAIGYVFRPDGYFTTAMFDVRTGEKVGEFDGQYRTLKSGGRCVIKFDVPNSAGPFDPIGYKVSQGKLIINDNKSQSQAVLARM